MMMGGDIRKRDQSLASWRVFGEGKCSDFLPNLMFCSVDKVLLVNMFFIRKNFLSGKRLNIFSPATGEEAEPAPGKEDF